jgi:hypothetical protein
MYKSFKNADNLNAVKSDGSIVTASSATGCVLATGGTYFFLLGGDYAFAGECPLSSVQLKWGAAFVGSFVLETSNFATKIGRPDPVGAVDVSDFDTTKGNWIQENPATAYVSVTSSDGTTGGATVANATVTVAGGTAGGSLLHIGNLGARRARLRVNVTTGDTIRCGVMSKGVGGAEA